MLTRARRLLRFRRYLRREPFDVSTEAGRSDERYRRAIVTAGSTGIARLVSMAALLISVPVALGYLGTERYGVVVTITALTAMLVFADFGLGNGLMNVVARATGRDDSSTAPRAISSAFFMLCAVAVVLTLGFIPVFLVAPWASLLNVTDPGAAAEIPAAVAVFAATVVLNLPLAVVHRVQLAYQQGFVNGVWNAVASVVMLVALVIAVQVRAPLPWIVLTAIGAPLLANALNSLSLFVVRRPDLRPRWSQTDLAQASALLRLGFLFFILQVSTAIAYQANVVVATRVLGPEAATEYSVVNRLFMVLPHLVNMLLLPLWPAYTEAIARGDTVWVGRTLRRSVGIALTLSGVASLGLVFAAPVVLRAWVGDAIQPPFALVLGMAIWAVVANSFHAVAMLLNAAAVIAFQVATAVAMAVVGIVASITFANLFGVSGVIWGTLLAYLVCSVIPIGLYLPRVLARLPEARAGAPLQGQGVPLP